MDVNHAAVQRAQRKVGDQLERERLARLKRRRYGPHSEADEPATVTVYAAGRGKWPTVEERPIPVALLKQRRQINAHANSPAAVAPVHPDPTAANAALIERLRG